ncbi:MAG: hypothetical protein HQK83_13920 [Fibrobacteria bacterium]|nr:hypothetical protein [Fibrobacteria bacterium]
MVRKILVMSLFLFFFQTYSQPSHVQLGISLLGPTGFCGKFWIDGDKAIDAAFSFSLGEHTNQLYFHSDFLMHEFFKFKVEGGKLPLYWGLGARLQAINNEVFDDNFFFGARVPLGVSYIYGETFDVFFELGPYLNFIPAPSFAIDGAIGFRFHI